MSTRIQYRRNTAAAAAASNPVLAVGEPGWETDTHKTKIGDGVTAWNSLPYQPNTTDLNATYDSVVKHGATAGTARPAGAVLVMWVGSVAPTNAATDDLWQDKSSSPAVLKRFDGAAFVQVATGVAGPTGSTGPTDLRGVDLARGTAVGSTFAAFDTFDRTDNASTLGTSDSGNAWTTRAGTVGVLTNKAYTPADAEGGADLDAGVKDCVVGADFYVADQTSDHGLNLHVLDANTRIVVVIIPSTTQLLIGKIVAGAFTVLAQFTKTWTTAQTYRLEASSVGAHLRFYVDGAFLGEYFLTASEVTTFKSNTRYGLYLKKTAWRADRFAVKATNRIVARSTDVEHRVILDPTGTLNNFNMNVAAVQHLDPVGISAIRSIAHDGVEKMAIGWGNASGTAALPYFGSAFVETSDVIQPDGSMVNTNPPPTWRTITTGLMSGRYESWVREEHGPDHKIRWFDAYAVFASRKAIMFLDQFAKRFFQPAVNTAPTDGDLIASQMTFYLDESGHNLKVRVRYSDNTTLKTATIPLA